jgi:hypothetical protein
MFMIVIVIMAFTRFRRWLLSNRFIVATGKPNEGSAKTADQREKAKGFRHSMAPKKANNESNLIGAVQYTRIGFSGKAVRFSALRLSRFFQTLFDHCTCPQYQNAIQVQVQVSGTDLWHRSLA